MISREVIEKVRERADIVDVISQYVSLKPSGKNYRGLCPFHKERTPSFTVSPEKQLFHCFGCGVGGNVFTFLMRYEGLSFEEAVRTLAERYGIEVQEAERKREKFGHLYELNRMAFEFYRSKLLHPKEGKAARDYLLSRGIVPRTWERFGLGYAPMDWEALKGFLESKGVDPFVAESAGLLVRGERGFYDRFRNRVIFPIEDHRNRILGFGGRSIDQAEPKYLNSPDTPVYRKGECLYGFKQARDRILQKREAIVVEGYFDVLSMAQYGFENVVAPLGTALTLPQLRLLKPIVEKVLLLFDGDEAGRKAALRAVELLLEEGMEGDVVILPEGEDPDSFLRSKGGEALLKGRTKAVEFYCKELAKGFDLKDPEGKYRMAQALVGLLERIEDPMKRRFYLEYFSDFLGVDPEMLLWRLRSSEIPLKRSRPPLPSAEEALVALCIQYPQALEWIKKEGVLELFASETLKEVLEAALEAMQEGADPSTEIPVLLQEKGRGEGVFSFLFSEGLDDPRKVFCDCVKRLKLKGLRRKREMLLEEIKEAERAGDEGKLKALLLQQQAFLKEERALLEGTGP